LLLLLIIVTQVCKLTLATVSWICWLSLYLFMLQRRFDWAWWELFIYFNENCCGILLCPIWRYFYFVYCFSCSAIWIVSRYKRVTVYINVKIYRTKCDLLHGMPKKLVFTQITQVICCRNSSHQRQHVLNSLLMLDSVEMNLFFIKEHETVSHLFPFLVKKHITGSEEIFELSDLTTVFLIPSWTQNKFYLITTFSPFLLHLGCHLSFHKLCALYGTVK